MWVSCTVALRDPEGVKANSRLSYQVLMASHSQLRRYAEQLFYLLEAFHSYLSSYRQ